LATKRGPEEEPERPASDLFSTSETKAMLEEFRALVRAGVLKVTPENEVLFVNEPVAGEKEAPPEALPTSEEEIQNLDRQLMTWLARNRERRTGQRAAAEPVEPSSRPAQPPAEARLGRLRQRVIERLADRILQRLESPEFERALRDEVIERVVEEMLRRWDRELK
jgi:hypothetical protein